MLFFLFRFKKIFLSFSRSLFIFFSSMFEVDLVCSRCCQIRKKNEPNEKNERIRKAKKCNKKKLLKIHCLKAN